MGFDPDTYLARKSGGFDPDSYLAASPAPAPSWGDVGTQAVQNLPASAKQFASDIVQPILHPIDTAENLYNVGSGFLQKMKGQGSAAPLKVEETDQTKAADAVVNFFSNRYGGLDNLKATIAKDPIGFLSDASVFLSGGGALAARAPLVAGKIAAPLAAAGAAADPVALAAKTAETVGKTGGRVVSDVVGNLGTHTGGAPLREAAAAGFEGGQRGEIFRDNMRGNVPVESVIGKAKDALSSMRADRGAEYRSGMADISKDKTVLDMAPVEQAIANVEGVKKFKGQDLSASTAGVRDEIKAAVDQWKALDPAEYHTPEGFDALKQKIGDIRDSTDYGSPSRKIADQAYNALKAEITKQAPAYAKVMKDYETASGLIDEVQRTLSLNPKANVDTTLRKLQSVMRNNVNTNYGRRGELVDKLGESGAATLKPALAGQALNSFTPRGLGSVAAGGTTVAAVASNPWLAALLIPQSPRLMGEAAYLGGRIAGGTRDYGQAMAAALAAHPVAAKMQTAGSAALSPAARGGQYQAGRADDVILQQKMAQLLMQ